MFNNDPFDSVNALKLVSNLWWKSVFIIIIFALILAIVAKLKGKKIEKIWLFAAGLVGFMFIVMMILTIINTFSLYQGF